MSKRDDIQLVLDMIESCERIQAYTAGSTGFESQMVCDAVTRNLEIIGEAANRLSEAGRSAHPECPWDEIRGFRNRLVHEYFGVDYDVVWMIVQHDIPTLLIHLKRWQAELS